ncbi:MAG: signal peptidase II [Mycoplasmoidaceae bacterium]
MIKLINMVDNKKNILEIICDYFKKANNKNTAIWKIVIFCFLALVVILPSFLIRDFMLNSENQDFNFMGNFIEGNIVSNTGVGLSIANGNPVLAYVLQGFSTFIPLVIFLFSQKKLMDIGTLLMFFGGMSNFIDRSIYDNFIHLANAPGIVPENAVVDYWRFGFVSNSFIFNYADLFISIGIILLIISLVFILVNVWKEDEKKEKIKKEVKNEKNNK